jgi:hypothetical protein
MFQYFWYPFETYLLGLVVAPRDDTPVLPVDLSVQGVTAVAAVPTVGATGRDVLLVYTQAAIDTLTI